MGLVGALKNEFGQNCVQKTFLCQTAYNVAAAPPGDDAGFFLLLLLVLVILGGTFMLGFNCGVNNTAPVDMPKVKTGTLGQKDRAMERSDKTTRPSGKTSMRARLRDAGLVVVARKPANTQPAAPKASRPTTDIESEGESNMLASYHVVGQHQFQAGSSGKTPKESKKMPGGSTQDV